MSTAAALNVPTELNFSNAVAFVEATAAGLGQGTATVDLAPLVHFDSAAVAALLTVERRARERGVDLRFVNPAPNLRKLATLYEVDGILFRD